MFWTFISIFNADILSFFGLETVWATFFKKIEQICFKSSGHPDIQNN
jgi:hypothetical protein